MGAARDAATGRELMSAADVGRTISRIAHQIIEKTALDGSDAPRVVLLGIPTRGVILAKRLATNIGEYSGVEVAHGALDITLYRDDLMRHAVAPQPVIRRTEIPFSIDDKRILLADDVLYTGRTIRAALDALIDFGRPKEIQLVVLVDRGHRELPIRADYVGRNIPTSRQQSVQVRLVEIDGRDEVEVEG
jgi:pyrimidine operon attenuation protein / uracil phosphoribosyltransferase